MNKKILTAMLVVCMLISSIPVFAETTCEYTLSNDKITLTGTTDEDRVTVAVFRQENYIGSDGIFDADKAFDALDTASDKAGTLIYSNQTTAKDSKYEFTMNFDRYPESSLDETVQTEKTVSGIYVAVIRAGSDVIEQEIIYVLESEKNDTLTDISELKNENDRRDEVLSIIKGKKFLLGIHTDHFDNIESARFDDMLFNAAEKSNYDFTDEDGTKIKRFISELKKAVAVATLNDGKMNSVEEYKDELGITSEKFNPWYTESFVNEEFKAALTQRVLSKDIKSTEEFDKLFAEALVTLYAQMSDGIGPLKEIFDTFKGAFGVTNSFSDDAYRSVLGESYSTFDELAVALSSYKSSITTNTNNNNVNTGGNSGSSGGGSFGGGGGGVNVAVPVTPSVTKPVETKTVFEDVSDSFWASQAIYALRDKAIISGKTSTAFSPDDNITREEFVKLVTAMANVELTEGELPFSDAENTAWYAKYLASAYKLGIIKGSSDGNFGIGESITRQDMAVMLARTVELIGKELPAVKEDADFLDRGEISDYAKDSLGKLQRAGVISGYTDGTVKPLGVATRAEAAQMIYNVMVLLK